MKNKLVIGLGIAALVFALVAYQFLTPKGAVDISRSQSAHDVKATTLYAAFEADEAAANTLYANTIMTVSGTITKVEKNESGQLQLSLDADSSLGSVMCTLESTDLDEQEINVGNAVIVKGICTGYLFDVVIDRAILLT